MGMRNTAEGWGWPARLLHWLMAVLIVGMLAFGFYLGFGFNAGDPAKIGLVQWHKSFGFTVFALACLRLIWRAVNRAPDLPAEMSGAERAAARIGHLALYVVMFAMPLTGWLMVTSSPFNDVDAYPMQMKNMVFGLFEMPDPYPEGDDALSRWFGQLHFVLGWVLAALLAGHVAAALKHHFVNRDGVLMRMLRS